MVAAVLCGALVYAESGYAQSRTDLRGFIRESISHVADSLFRMHGEAWSGTVWSEIPEWRKTGNGSTGIGSTGNGTPVNGFMLKELIVESSGSSVDPSGQEFVVVSVAMKGELLFSDGRIAPVDVDRPASILRTGDRTFDEEYADLLNKDSSVWSNVILPTVVALGAAIVIALFFIVRS